MSNKYLFKEVVQPKGGFLRGPFGGDLKKEIFVEKGSNTYKVYEQGVVLNSDKSIGRYYISEKDYIEKLHKFSVQDKDFLVSCSGVNMGAIYQLKEPFEKGIINQALLRIRLNNELIDDNYFFYLFKELISRKITTGSGDSTIPNFPGLDVIKNIEFELPAKDIQKKVGKILFDIDAKIELNQRINAELESMAKTLYDYWFVQFAPHKSAGGKMVWNEKMKREIPLGWEVLELSKIVSRIATGLNPRKNFVFGNGNNYYVTIKNIDYGRVLLDDRCDKIDDEAMKIIDRRSDLQVGDILFTSIEPVGKTYLLQEKPTNWNINESVFTIRPNYDLVTPEYLYALLSSDMIKSFTDQSSAGSTFKGIRIGVLNTFLSAYPNKRLISEFSEIAKPILKKINISQKESQTLTELRDWLLSMLMNGQVTIQ